MRLFVPGRICLFGEHSDWAGGYRRTHLEIEKGYTLICGTNQGIYAKVDYHPDQLQLQTTTADGEHLSRCLSIDDPTLLDEASKGEFWSYIAGVAYQVRQRFDVGGLIIDNYKTDLPMQKGLSSSAAVCVLTARAFNLVYDLGLSVRDEMELAYLGEITTPSQCGRMDQGCAFGNRPILMTFDGDSLTVDELTVGAPIHLVIVDLGAYKDTQRILADLNACYPDVEGEVAEGVRGLFGRINHQITTEAITALQAGNAQQLGTLMTQAQAQFDRYAMPACPAQLTSPVLHRVLEYPPLQTLSWGGKGVGSQGDGSAQFVARSAVDQQILANIIERELGMQTLQLTITSTS